jgi:hypothetical protein
MEPITVKVKHLKIENKIQVSGIAHKKGRQQKLNGIPRINETNI